MSAPRHLCSAFAAFDVVWRAERGAAFSMLSYMLILQGATVEAVPCELDYCACYGVVGWESWEIGQLFGGN